jgi:signal transduction histidine kinase
MGTFASGLAHEIKNPLGAIKGTAQLLAEDLGPNHSSSEYIHIIMKEVNRLDALIREVQAYSQPASEKVPADLNRLVQEIISLAEADPRLKEKSFLLDRDLSPLPSGVVSKNQFRQALLNIILNAIEAVPENGAVRIKTRFDKTAPLPIEISVSNEGPPIPPDIQNQIFEPFYTTKAAGTGLGLSIARQVVANHGGRLNLDCSEGWITFSILLPDNNTTPLGTRFQNPV